MADYDNTQREAFLAISPEGETILTCAHGEFARPAFMFASTDGGDTFQELEADVPGVSGDCDVAISQKSWAFLHSTVAGATVATTQDDGRTWIVNPISAIPVNGLADRPWMEYHDETLLLSFMPLSVQPGTIGFTRSADHGASWSTPTWIVPPDPQWPNVIQGRFLVDSHGNLVIPLMHSSAGGATLGLTPFRFGFALSGDGGISWTYRFAFETLADLGNPMGVSISGNTTYWAYGAPAGSPDLVVRISADDGATWGEPITVGHDMRWSRPWAVEHEEGFMDILWQQAGGPRGGNEDIAKWHVSRIYPNGSVEAIGEDLVPDYSRAFAEFAELARRPDGRLIAAVPDVDQDHGVIRLLEEVRPANE